MLEQYINKFWLQVFKDALFIDRLLRGLDDRYAQTTEAVNTLNNDLSRHDVDVFRKQLWMFVTYDETQMNQDAMLFDQDDVFFNGLYDFGDRLHNFFTLPISTSLQKIPFITSSPVEPTVVLQENIDYMVNYEQGLIFFRTNPFDMGFEKHYVTGITEPDIGIGMWFYHADKDFNDIDDIYAKTVKLNVTSSEYFKRIVNCIWDLRVEGGTINNVNKLLLATVDADFVTEGGELLKLFTEGGREWAQIGDNLYSAPETTPVLPTVGDTIVKGEIIWGSVEIYTGLDDISYDSFPALHLSSNFIGDEFTDGVMVENIDYPFPEEELFVFSNYGEYLIQDLTAAAYTYLVDNVNGFIIDLLVTDGMADYTAFTGRRDLPFQGRTDTVESFKDYILGVAASEGHDLTSVIIADNNGKVPETINLFTEYQQRAFKNNAFFVSVDTSLIPDGVDPGMFLSYLKFTVPAYTTLLTFLGASSTVTYSTENITDTAEAFHVVTVEETYSGDNITDNVNRKLSI